MDLKPKKNSSMETGKLSDEEIWKLPLSTPEVIYRPVPDNRSTALAWRVRFDLAFDPSRCLGLDVNGEVTLGRGKGASDFVDLSGYDADNLGVSRRHAMLRPTETNLYLLDLGSTNGTWRNGYSIGVNTPYSLAHGDLIRIGQLELVVRIIKRPSGHTAAKAELSDTFIPMARAITSHLDFNEVLKQALDMATSLTFADEASVWLVDEKTGELFLEASRGIQDEQIKRMRLPVTDTLAGKVVEEGKPLSASGTTSGEQVKVKTGYLVDAVVYVPLMLGGVTFGVLSAAHRKPGNAFTPRDEKLLAMLADLTAIAVQNSRLHDATTSTLSRQDKILTALNYALSYDLKNMANLTIGYADLLGSYCTLDDENADIVKKIGATGNKMTHLIGQLLDVSAFSDTAPIHRTACNLEEIAARAISGMESEAQAKSIQIAFTKAGQPYLVQGDQARLYRGVHALLTNAIKYSPPEATVSLDLAFKEHGLTISVCDNGPSIPEDDLPHIFTQYSRGGQTSNGQTTIEMELALVWAAAEAHRGSVAAHNLDGQGVEFSMTLPPTIRLAHTNTDPRQTVA